MSYDPESAREIARKALIFIAGDSEVSGNFLSMSGLRAEDLRVAAESSEFLLHVLDFIVEMDDRVIAFTTFADVRPEEVMLARTVLAGPGSHGWDVD